MLRRRRYLLSNFILGRSGGFSPRSLFAAGEVGAWYDPSDITTLFQDSAGTTPVTAPGQVVGRILDKSGRGNHATQTGATSLMPVYQVDANGRGYLEFDGIDDWLQTNTITPGANKVAAIVGLRKNSDAAAGAVLETSATSASNTGTVALLAPSLAATTNYLWRSYGSVLAQASPTVAAPATSVVTGLGDIAGDVCIARVNGAVAASASTDQGTGNYAAHPLYIGRRAGTSTPFNGRLYGLILRFSGTQLSDAQIAAAERWMNRRTGAF